MNAGLISIRYAKALLGLALEKNILERVYSDVKLIKDQYNAVANLSAILESPVVKPNEKKQLFIKGFEASINEFTLKFLLLVVENQRESLLKFILIDFEDLYKQHLGIKQVHLVTAVALDATFENMVKDTIAKELNTAIEFTIEVKPELIGGFIIIIDGKMLDTSISNKLRLLKKSLLA